MTVSVSDNNDIISLSASNSAPKFVKITPNYLPDDLYFNCGKYFSDNPNRGLTLVTSIIKGQTTINDTDILSFEQLESNGNDVIIAKLPSNDFDRKFYVYFEDKATLVEDYVQSGITDDELLDIINGISVEECSADDEKAISLDNAYSNNDTTVFKDIFENITDAFENITNPTPHYNIHEVKTGTKIHTEYGMDYTIENIEVLDNISNLDYNSFNIPKSIASISDENGQLLSFDRNMYTYGDGVNSPNISVDSSQQANYRLVYATLTIENPTDEAADFMFRNFDLGLIKNESEELTWLYSDDEPQPDIENQGEVNYIDNNNVSTDGQKAGYYLKTLAPGETAVVHIGLLASDVSLDNLYLTNSPISEGGFDEKTNTLSNKADRNIDGSYNYDILCTKVR